MRRLATATPAALGALTVVVALGLAGCGSSSDDTSTTPAPTSVAPTSAAPTSSAATSSSPAAASLIVIEDFAYTGATRVSAGATVSVRNDDAEAHTVTSDRGSAFDLTIQPGETATFTAPAKAGDYAYHCTYHATMHGSLTVA